MTVTKTKETRAGFGKWRITYKGGENVILAQEVLDQNRTHQEAQQWANEKAKTLTGCIGAIIDRD